MAEGMGEAVPCRRLQDRNGVTYCGERLDDAGTGRRIIAPTSLNVVIGTMGVVFQAAEWEKGRTVSARQSTPHSLDNQCGTQSFRA